MKNIKRCVIIGGASIKKYNFIRRYFNKNDCFVFCDSGLKHMKKLKVKPYLVIGDFDSYNNPNLDSETIVLPREKNDTDTFYAAKEMLKRGFEDFLLIGVIGERLDHSLGNISILLYLNKFRKSAKIIDDFSEIEIISPEKPVFIKNTISNKYKFKFFSLINITGLATGITIKNAKYPLENAEITCEYQYGISNEVLPGKTAEISIKSGKLLLIKNYLS